MVNNILQGWLVSALEKYNVAPYEAWNTEYFENGTCPVVRQTRFYKMTKIIIYYLVFNAREYRFNVKKISKLLKITHN